MILRREWKSVSLVRRETKHFAEKVIDNKIIRTGIEWLEHKIVLTYNDIQQS